MRVANARNGAAPGPTGSAEQPARTRPSTLSGYASAVSSAMYPPSERPTTRARPVDASASVAGGRRAGGGGRDRGRSGVDRERLGHPRPVTRQVDRDAAVRARQAPDLRQPLGAGEPG